MSISSFKITGLTLLVCCLIHLASASIIKNCGGRQAVASLDSVQIKGCDLEKDTSCLMVRGTDAAIDVKFTPTKQITSGKVRVGGKMGPVWVPFPVMPEEACGNYGLQCPVAAKTSGQISLSLPVRPAYPKLKLGVQFKLVDERDNTIFCIEFPAKIVDP